MKILIGHNRYQWLGGEDAVVQTESQLLKDAGHEVCLFEADNNFLQNSSGVDALTQVPRLFWSKESHQRLLSVLRDFRPDVAHFHNIYFALTPAVYDACRQENVPVVQTLHNFRMLCANALFFRDGHVCEDCIDRSPLEGIRHACYRKSPLASAAVVAMTSFHRLKKTWINKVDTYITATEFTRRKYIDADLPAYKIQIKPNAFYPDVIFSKPKGEYVLYVGRLSEEKGVQRLLQAWEHIKNIPLKLMGDGPLAQSLNDFAREKNLDHVEFLGHVDMKQYDSYMRGAKFIVIPSQCYENFPRIAVEAFAYGLPILASRLGSLQEITVPGENGFCFDPLSEEDLCSQTKKLWQMDISQMSQRSRQIFDQQYSPRVNLGQLMNIYSKTIDNMKKR